MTKLKTLLTEIRGCTLCAKHFSHRPRPIVRAKASARIMIVGQAPGTKVHDSGIPWNDKSGDRLREWLAVDSDIFYDEARFAIVPMGFCFPGQDAKGGDLPPRPECAPTWHPQILPLLPKVDLTILIGQYAQARYLGDRRKDTLTETVQAWRSYGPSYLPLPHPSWRNTG